MMAAWDSNAAYVHTETPLGDTKIVMTYIKVCVCGADAMKDGDEEYEMCASCWVHLRDQMLVEAVIDGGVR
jgi:hypothetical protein